MASPVDVVKGRIVGYDEKRGELLIRAPYADLVTMTRREYKECLVQPVDSRRLSDKQRKACYALMGAIADYSGMSRDRTKELMKLKFLSENVEDLSEQIFSLSNAPMSLVCGFQRFLVQFILEWDIPTDFSLLDMVDDVSDYIYGCLVNKKCVVCGRPADLHHIDRVGAGRNRDEIIHEGMEVLPLCREHHTEAHTMPDKDFFDKYHLPGGIVADKTICRIYGLKRRKTS